MKKLLSFALIILLASVMIIPVSAAVPDGYVSDGLVAFYDADGVAAGTTTWVDLSGNNNDITDVPATDTCKFTGSAYLNTATRVFFPTAVKDALLGDEWTTEMVLGTTTVTGTTWGTYLNSTNDNYSLFYRGNDTSIVLKNNGATPNTRPTYVLSSYTDLENATVTITFKAGGDCIMYINGQQVASANGGVAITPDDFYFGHNDASKSHTTEYKSIRFYSTALTADQVAANYAADIDEGTGDGEDSSKETNPETGDMLIVFVIVAAAASVCAVTVVKIRR